MVSRSELSLRQLCSALTNKAFTLHFQPIISLVSGKVQSAEALLRLIDDDGSLIAPKYFIGLAEQTGFISEITKEIIPIVCESINLIHKTHSQVAVSFNVSSKDFTGTWFVDEVARNLSQYQVPAQTVHIEITETAFLPVNPGTRQQLFDLHALGTKIVLNDFSAGYSTFGYLSQLPFSSLKIAMPLVQRIHSSNIDFRLFRHLVSLGHQLELDVTAEGIENQELHDLVLSTGCTSSQGYYYSHPLPLTEFLNLLDQQPTWVNYPFGMEYLTQIDLVDLRRDIIREALIIHANRGDPEKQLRARNRLPSLEYADTELARWYFSMANQENKPPYYERLGKVYERFQQSGKALIAAADQVEQWEMFEQLIDRFVDASLELMQDLQRISMYRLVSQYKPLS